MNNPPRDSAAHASKTENERRNAEFFDGWSDYHEMVDTSDTYRYCAQALRGELAGRVVDVGSGGMINYDCGELAELVLVDIGETFAQASLPPRATPMIGSAVALPLESVRYDCVLMQMLVHHLAEDDFATTRARVVEAFREAHRVLRPGGELVVLESVMPAPLEWAQRLAFPLTRWILARIKHPLVFQWTATSLRRLAAEAGFALVEATPVPRGRRMIFLGRRRPTWLIPVRFSKVVARKAA